MGKRCSQSFAGLTVPRSKISFFGPTRHSPRRVKLAFPWDVPRTAVPLPVAIVRAKVVPSVPGRWAMPVLLLTARRLQELRVPLPLETAPLPTVRRQATVLQ